MTTFVIVTMFVIVIVIAIVIVPALLVMFLVRGRRRSSGCLR